MSFLIVAFTVASATNVVLPDAVSVESGGGYALAEGFGANSLGEWSGTGSVRVGAGVSGRLTLGASVGPYVAPYPVPFVMSENLDALLVGTSARYHVIQTPAFGLAPWVAGTWGLRSGPDLGLLVGGIAIEGGGDWVRADLSVPLVGAGLMDGEWGVMASPLLWAASEGGLTFRPSQAHSWRIAATSLIPHIDYRYRTQDGWVWGLDVGGWPGAVHLVRGTVGFDW